MSAWRDPVLLAGTAVVAVAVLITALLGWWQLASWRDAQAADAADRLDREPVALAEVLGPDEALAGTDVGVPVRAVGRYASAPRQFLVSGREHGGSDGYWVLSPFEVEATGSSLLVVRGWTADAGELPPVPTGRVAETGVLQPGEEGSGTVTAGRVVPAVRIPALVGELDTDLYGAYLLRTGDQPADPAVGLEPVPPARPDASWSAGLRNLTYAAQWWAFGAFACFWWWRLRADRLASPGR